MPCPGWIAQLQTPFVQIFLLVFGQTVETVILDMDAAKFAVFNTSQIIEFEKLAVNPVYCRMIVLDAQLIQDASANVLVIHRGQSCQRPAALVLDSTGAFGVAQICLSASRLLGTVLLLIGVIIIQRQ